MQAADISPIEPAQQTQSPADLLLIFVGANIVATTFQVGASIGRSFTTPAMLGLIVAGSIAGAALVAALAPIGSRLRIPSIVAARPALGVGGAAAVAVVLYVTNFAWIALNNVIAASACARAASDWVGPGGNHPTAWAIALGIAATAIVWRGPEAVARADRLAVPLMGIVAVALTVACVRAPQPTALPPGAVPMSLARGFDVVVGYQVSWILMFADYSRYTRSIRGATTAVFLGLATTSIWMMPLGAVAARAAGTDDPGAMLAAVGIGGPGALLLAVATLTTNFVNIYMSALAWKSLVPGARDGVVVWSVGLIGTALSAIPNVWLEQYTNFMVLLGSLLVPVGGLLVAHYYLRGRRNGPVAVSDFYDPGGPYRGVCVAGAAAWIGGGAVYFAARSIGGTLPALLVSIAIYALAVRLKPDPTISRSGAQSSRPA